jgi:hypothetical protein
VSTKPGLKIGTAAVVDIRVGLFAFPDFPWIGIGMSGSVFVELLLKIDASSAERTNDQVRTDACTWRDVATRISKAWAFLHVARLPGNFFPGAGEYTASKAGCGGGSRLGGDTGDYYDD